MNKTRLKASLDGELELWACKTYTELAGELSDVVAYERGEGADFHQFEVQLLEREPDYVHVLVSIGDGSLRRFISPLNRSFIVRRDGRVET